jgi:hypothetical protein
MLSRVAAHRVAELCVFSTQMEIRCYEAAGLIVLRPLG